MVRPRSIEGFPWPEVTVYARAGATPAEVMAVYVDFNAHVTFLPEMVQSRIVGHDGPTVWRVFYEYEVDGPNERYTVTARLRRVTGGYETAWDLVTARYARRLSGEMRVLGTAATASFATSTGSIRGHSVSRWRRPNPWNAGFGPRCGS